MSLALLTWLAAASPVRQRGSTLRHGRSPGSPSVRTRRALAALEFIGGLEMVSGDRDLGALSAFRFTSPGKAFFGIADTGFWFWGEVEHDQAGAPSGITSFRMQEMQGPDGAPSSEKWLTDGEGWRFRAMSSPPVSSASTASANTSSARKASARRCAILALWFPPVNCARTAALKRSCLRRRTARLAGRWWR